MCWARSELVPLPARAVPGLYGVHRVSSKCPVGGGHCPPECPPARTAGISSRSHNSGVRTASEPGHGAPREHRSRHRGARAGGVGNPPPAAPNGLRPPRPERPGMRRALRPERVSRPASRMRWGAPRSRPATLRPPRRSVQTVLAEGVTVHGAIREPHGAVRNRRRPMRTSRRALRRSIREVRSPLRAARSALRALRDSLRALRDSLRALRSGLRQVRASPRSSHDPGGAGRSSADFTDYADWVKCGWLEWSRVGDSGTSCSIGMYGVAPSARL